MNRRDRYIYAILAEADRPLTSRQIQQHVRHMKVHRTHMGLINLKLEGLVEGTKGEDGHYYWSIVRE